MAALRPHPARQRVAAEGKLDKLLHPMQQLRSDMLDVQLLNQCIAALESHMISNVSGARVGGWSSRACKTLGRVATETGMLRQACWGRGH